MSSSYLTPTKRNQQVQWREGTAEDNSPYTHMETHHIIKFKPPTATVTPDNPRKNSRRDARLAMKKRLGAENKAAAAKREKALSSSFSSTGTRRSDTEHYHVIENDNISVASSGTGILKNPITISKLSSGNGGGSRRGRERSRSRSRSFDPRSNSLGPFSRRSLSLSRRSMSKGRNARDRSVGPSGDCSVCSARSNRSNMSLHSVRSTGSRVMKKMRSIGKSASFRLRKRRKKKRQGEKVVFVKQTHEPFPSEPKRRKQVEKPLKNGGLMGMLCGSFDNFNLCGTADDEELIGKVIGVEDSMDESSCDPYDPRASPNRSGVESTQRIS